MIFSVILYAVLIPCGVEGAVLLTAWLMRRSAADPKSLGWAGALGAGLAYMAGHLGLYRQWPTFNDVGHLVFYVALSCTLLQILHGIFTRIPNAAMWVMRAAIAAAGLWLILGPYKSPLWFSGLFFAMMLLWFAWQGMANRQTDRTSGIVILIWTLGVSGALAISGAAKFGLLAGVLSAAAGLIIALSLINANLGFSRGMILVSAPIAFLLGVEGMFYADLPRTSAALLVAAPLSAWLAETKCGKEWKPWKLWLLRLAAIGIPIAIAVAIAVINSPVPQSYEE
jgi:hypothetical protein